MGSEQGNKNRRKRMEKGDGKRVTWKDNMTAIMQKHKKISGRKKRKTIA